MKDELTDPSAGTRSRWTCPHLMRAAETGAIVIFGGEVRRPKLAELHRRTGLRLEWVALRDAARLVRRARQGTIAAVVVIEGFVDHASSDRVIRALRWRAIPYVHAGRGGVRRVMEALATLEVRLTDSRCATSRRLRSKPVPPGPPPSPRNG